MAKKKSKKNNADQLSEPKKYTIDELSKIFIMSKPEIINRFIINKIDRSTKLTFTEAEKVLIKD